MSELRFTVKGAPKGKGRPRFGNGRAFTPKATAAYEDLVAREATDAMANHWGPPKSGPVFVTVTTYRKRPGYTPPSHEARSGWRWTHPDGEHALCTKKPDADNQAKIILDGCGQAGVWDDDAQVVGLEVLKLWCNEGEEPRADVYVWTLD